MSKSRRAALWRPLSCSLVAVLAGCRLYHPLSLASPEDLVRRQSDAETLRVSAAELHHPLLPPLSIDLADGLDPMEAAVLAVAGNPGLVAERDARGEASADLIAAGLLPNPTFSGELDSTSGPGSDNLVVNRVLNVSIDTRVLVTRATRLEAARAHVDSVDLEIAWKEWQVAQAARLDTVRLIGLRRRLARLTAEIEGQEQTTAVLEHAVSTGDASLPSLGVQRAALESSRRVRRDLTASEIEARSQLLELLGLSPVSRLDVAESLPADPEVPTGTDESGVVQHCLARRLDLAALRRGYDSQQARLRQAVLEQLPDIQVGFASQRNESSIKFLGGFASLGLPIFDRNQAEIALAEATRARLGHEYEARVLGVRAEVAAALEAGRAFDAQIAQASRSLPEARALEAAERDAIKRGDVDRLTYQVVRTNLLELELGLESLSQARHEVAVALETSCGGWPFANESATPRS
jgi:outer membrane protein TolC